MPVVGAVFHLSDEPTARAAALASLGGDPRITLGELRGDNLPLVLETGSAEEDRAAWRALGELPGIDQIVVTFADVSDCNGSLPQGQGD